MRARIHLLFFAFSFCLSHNTFAQVQSFEKRYDTLGCYYAKCIRQSFDGGYLMFGSSYSLTTQQDLAIIKTDSLGNLIWVKIYGGPNTDGAKNAVVTPDSNYLVVGIKDASANNSIWILKINNSGDTLWTKTTIMGIGDNTPTSVENTYDGGFIITGYCSARGMGLLDVYLIKINAIGDTLWSKTYGNVGTDQGFSVKQTTDSGFVIAGVTNSSGSSDAYVIKTNSVGDTIWTKAFGFSNVDWANSIQQTHDLGYIVSGYSWNVTANNYEIYLIKLNNNGDSVWTKHIGDVLENYSENLQLTQDGGFILCGTTWTNNNNYDAFLVRTDSLGDTLWTKKFGGNNEEKGYFVQNTNDGGFVLTGSSDSYLPNSVYLVKTDSLGNLFTNIKLISSDYLFYVFPNPTSESLHIKSFSNCDIHKIEYKLFNLMGTEIKSNIIEVGDFDSEINLNGITSGIYIIELFKNGILIHSYKIIII